MASRFTHLESRANEAKTAIFFALSRRERAKKPRLIYLGFEMCA
jgi:hypothetical protein